MSRLIKGALLLLIAIYSQISLAQNYYNSPYTNFGIGDLINNGFAANRAMGGTSIALRSHNQVNYLNPASYTSQDTNSFLFQAGFTGRFVEIKTSDNSDQSNNMNIEYLAIGFPVKRWLNLSVGLVPYSRIQYAFLETHDSESAGESTSLEQKGFGGFNEFYIGGGLTIKKVLSVGINLNYVFGSLDRTQTSYLTNLTKYSAKIEKTGNLIANDFYTKLGVQYHPVINDKHTLIIGATLDAKANIDIKDKSKIMRMNYAEDESGVIQFSDTLSYEQDTIVPMIFPNKLGIGLSYNYDDIVTVTAEYIQQDWSGTKIAPSNFSIGKYESIRFGVEYMPVPFKKKTRESYFKRIRYRAGGYLTKTYLYHNGNNIPDKGVSVGVGLPWKNPRKMFTGSSLNIGYQYGIRGTTDNGLIKETYHIVTLGLTLHDFWFYKPKYD